MTEPLNIPPGTPQFKIGNDDWELQESGSCGGVLFVQVPMKVVDIASQPDMELRLLFVKKEE